MAEGHNGRRGDRDDYKKVAIVDTWKATILCIRDFYFYIEEYLQKKKPNINIIN